MVQPMQAMHPGATGQTAINPQMMAAFQQQMMLGYAPHTMACPCKSRIPPTHRSTQAMLHHLPCNGATPQQPSPVAGAQSVVAGTAGMDPSQMAAYTAAYGGKSDVACSFKRLIYTWLSVGLSLWILSGLSGILGVPCSGRDGSSGARPCATSE